jgi:hypothetical protein
LVKQNEDQSQIHSSSGPKKKKRNNYRITMHNIIRGDGPKVVCRIKINHVFLFDEMYYLFFFEKSEIHHQFQ